MENILVYSIQEAVVLVSMSAVSRTAQSDLDWFEESRPGALPVVMFRMTESSNLAGLGPRMSSTLPTAHARCSTILNLITYLWRF